MLSSHKQCSLTYSIQKWLTSLNAKLIDSLYLLNLMLKTSRQLLRRLAFSFSSPESLESLQIKKQRAKWACKFISTICDSPSPENITDPSLRDLLLNCTISNPKTEEVEREMKAFFRQGKYLNVQVYHQDRMTKARHPRTKQFRFFPTYLVSKQIFEKLSEEVGEQMLLHGNYGVGKTSSFILYCELAKIINDYIHAIKLKNQFDQKKLDKQEIFQVGQVFYWSLDSYKVDQKDKKDSNNANQSQDKLKTKTGSQNYSKEELVLIKSLLASFSEKEKELHKNKSARQLIDHILQINSSEPFKPFIIIDQINTVASVYRQKNGEINKMISKGKLPLNQSFLDEPQMKPTKQLVGLLRYLKQTKFPKIFNSSVNIETRYFINNNFSDGIFQNLRYEQYFESMNIVNSHPGFSSFSLHYAKNIKTDWGLIDFKHSIWHHLEQKLENVDLKETNKTIRQEKIAQLKKIYYQQVCNYQSSIQLRMLHIREGLQAIVTDKLKMFLTKKSSQIQNKKFIKSFLFSLKNISRSSLKKNIRKNILKTNMSMMISKLQLYLDLRDHAQRQRERIEAENGLIPTNNPTEDDKVFSKYDTLLEFNDRENKKLYQEFQMLVQREEIDKEMISFQIQEEDQVKKIIFNLKISEFQRLFTDAIGECLKELKSSPVKLQEAMHETIYSGNKITGSAAEFYLIQILSSLGTTMKIKSYSLENFHQVEENIEIIALFRAYLDPSILKQQIHQKGNKYQPSTTQPSIKKQKNLSQKRVQKKYSYGEMIKLVLSNPDKDYMVTPGKHTDGQFFIQCHYFDIKQHNQNTPSFDWMLVKCQTQNGKKIVVFNTYDSGVTNNLKNITDKFEAATKKIIKYQNNVLSYLRQFNKLNKSFFKPSNFQVKFFHTVVCLKEHWEKRSQIQKTIAPKMRPFFKIAFFDDIEDIKTKKKEYATLFQVFNEITSDKSQNESKSITKTNQGHRK